MSENEKKLYCILSISLGVILSLIIATYLMISLIRVKKVQLQDALDTISELNRVIDTLKLDQSNGNNSSDRKGTIADDTTSITEMRREYSSELIKLKQRMSVIKDIPNNAKGSEGYNIVAEFLHKDRVLNDKNEIWQQINNSIDNTCPNFKSNLNQIAKRTLSVEEHHLVVLIRLGFSTTEISKIIGKSKSATSYRRQKICNTVFFGIITPQELDLAIRLL